ncbi:hypothetical protein LJK87_21330 [Paenibacillus sp. P25]|nr:hypothetical protein LJK87_21330 [Paenibacillus sp. P25]
MNWNERLAGWIGRPVSVAIGDPSGMDPAAPPRSFILGKLCLTVEGMHLQFFLSDHQFVAVPLFEDGGTTLTEREFISVDRASSMHYRVRLELEPPL